MYVAATIITLMKLTSSAEGPFTCSNVTIQNNDIGPCGSDVFQEVPSCPCRVRHGRADKQWADGISLSCQSSLVQNNVIVDATDGGIVIFGAPFSTIRNNTISVKTRTTLGGINCTSCQTFSWRDLIGSGGRPTLGSSWELLPHGGEREYHKRRICYWCKQSNTRNMELMIDGQRYFRYQQCICND